MNTNKRRISILIVLAIAISMLGAIPTFASGLNPIYGSIYLNDQLNFKLDGKTVVPVGDDGTPVLPISYNGTTYLPVRAVGYLLGLGIDWEQSTKTVIITSTTTKEPPTPTYVPKTNQLTRIWGALLNGQLKFRLDGEPVVPVGDDGTPVLPISYNGTTYLPVRALGYLLGLGIDWDGPTKTVIITTTGSNYMGPGWYFTRWEYIESPADGSRTGRYADGSTYTDYSDGIGDKNNFSIKTSRVYNGKVVASGSVTDIWTDPPKYFGVNDKPTMNYKREVESTWGINSFSISFDLSNINPGGGTAGKLNFVSPEGQGYLQAYDGTMQLKTVPKGKPGDEKAVIIHQSGYGFKYYYEWRD